MGTHEHVTTPDELVEALRRRFTHVAFRLDDGIIFACEQADEGGENGWIFGVASHDGSRFYTGCFKCEQEINLFCPGMCQNCREFFAALDADSA